MTETLGFSDGGQLKEVLAQYRRTGFVTSDARGLEASRLRSWDRYAGP